MASIHRKASGKWCVRWKDPDGRHRQHTTATRRTAGQIQRDAQDAEDRGVFFEPRRIQRAPLVVARPGVTERTALGAYLADRRRTWRASTLQVRTTELQVWAEWLLDRYRSPTVGMFSQAWLSEYWAHLVDDRGCGERTANNRTRQVAKFWRWCRDSEEFGDETPRVREIDLVDPVRAPAPAPTWAMMAEAVEVACASQAPWWGRLFEVMRCTGLRGGQVMRLRWEDVDLEARTLRIRGELGKTRQERRGRTVPLAPCLAETLSGWGVRDGWLIVPTGRNGKPTSNRHPNHATPRRLWARTGAPPEVYAQPRHTFRRGFVSELAAAGVRSEVRKALVGHARGTHGDTYTDASRLWPQLVEAVALVPSLAEASADAPFRAAFAQGDDAAHVGGDQ